ncbi:MAG: glycosyl hydrolase family 28-related protein, partial [Verrucomicrobia bacterium]|nr:glycosyl hydrolase family 28-related protein [Verrucomicrobiota bacterium]
MNRFLITFLCVTFIGLQACAQNNRIIFGYTDFGQVPQTGRQVKIYPFWLDSVNPSGLTTLDRRVLTTDKTTGLAVATNMVPGLYRAEFSGVWRTTTNWFTFTNIVGTVYASNYVASAYALAGSTIPAFSQSQSDARYWRKGVDSNLDGGSVTNAKTLSANTVLDQSNVRWWGAKGDRLTDDTAAIQAAFDAITNSGGGTIYFPPGTYALTALQFGNVVPPDARTNGWIIKGAGSQATTLRITTNGAIGLNLIGQFNVTVQDLTIDTAPGITAQTAVFVARDDTSFSCNWVHFKNVFFVGTYSKAVVVHLAAEMCTYKDCTFQPLNAVPCLYTARDNDDIGITNNQGTFQANTTTANAARDCHFLAYVAGSSGFMAYGSVGWTL